jgi:omega-6 fatty acid desaturase (delta-12 desaturase)
VREVRAAIPPHCFERSTLTSLAYAARDVAGMLSLAWLASRIDSAAAPAVCSAALGGVGVGVGGVGGVGGGGAFAAFAASWCEPAVASLLWLVYWYACGCVATGWWMIGHECGHGAFSESRALNYVVGYVAHTSLLVPFSAWAITHARHHGATNSLEHDEPFVPSDKKQYSARRAFGSMLESGAFAAVALLLMLVGGWPAYLLADLGGPSKYARRGGQRDHFAPWSALFKENDAWTRASVGVGTMGIIGVLALLGRCAALFGWRAVAAYYIVPLLVVNAHLVTITYLQHTHLGVPHFREGEHSWLRGALCTVDRSWGAARDVLFHHISDTHVVHHLFHEMPFYHASEATRAVRKALGPYYLRDDTPVELAMWRAFRECRFVEPDAGGPPGVEWMRSFGPDFPADAPSLLATAGEILGFRGGGGGSGGGGAEAQE